MVLWRHNFVLWTEVAFPLNRGPFYTVSTLWFFDSGALNGPFQLTLSNGKGDRYIKAALQALGNILLNQNSPALMSEWVSEQEKQWKRENDTFFFNVTRGATVSISACWNLMGRKKKCLFFSFWPQLRNPRNPLSSVLHRQMVECWAYASRVVRVGFGGGWLTLKVAEVSSGPVWAYRGYPVLSPV